MVESNQVITTEQSCIGLIKYIVHETGQQQINCAHTHYSKVEQCPVCLDIGTVWWIQKEGKGLWYPYCNSCKVMWRLEIERR